MEVEHSDSGSIGPDISLDEVALPPVVGERFRELYGADERPTDGAEWIEMVGDGVEATVGRRPTVEDLCTSADGVHEFVDEAGSRSYVCVLDPLAYPFLTGATGTVRSETPVRETTVEFEIREDGVDVSPPDAVVSLGVSDHVAYVEDLSPEVIYQQVCGYIQTFADEEEYATWAADVEAATTHVTATDGVAVAREIARTLFDSEAAPTDA